LFAEDHIRAKWEALSPLLNERQRRVWAGAEAREIGHGGVAAVCRATGLAPNTVKSGLLALQQPEALGLEPTRSRREGGGRKSTADAQPGLVEALEAMVEPVTRGDPMSPLRWTCKSTQRLAKALGDQGFSVSANTVGSILRDQGYSLQGLQKTREGGSHPDRDAQFRHIGKRVSKLQNAEQPVISVDCKKKELVGDFKNGGREYQPQGEPETVRVHDFIDKKLGKAIPYGVYDVTRNEGWVTVGVDHETAEFAVNTIREWWNRMGRHRYSNATELLIVADGGGSNGSRNRAWKIELQDLADRTGLKIHVSHLPPGTSKWNKIEHRMFSYITQNWRGRPLLTHEVVVSLIGATTTTTGLKIRAALDHRPYATGTKVSDADLREIQILPQKFHGEWNYTISPLDRAAR
jgi:hypothetical protein